MFLNVECVHCATVLFSLQHCVLFQYVQINLRKKSNSPLQMQSSYVGIFLIYLCFRLFVRTFHSFHVCMKFMSASPTFSVQTHNVEVNGVWKMRISRIQYMLPVYCSDFFSSINRLPVLFHYWHLFYSLQFTTFIMNNNVFEHLYKCVSFICHIR